MKKPPFIMAMMLCVALAGLRATHAAPDETNPFASPPQPSPTPKPPTEITAVDDFTFSQKTHIAVFTGHVHVKDPEYIIDCDKLTAYLKKTAVPGAKVSPTPTPAKTAKPAGSPDPEAGGINSSLDRAICEGNVVILEDKIDAKTGKLQHYVGKSQKAVYDSATGDMTLTVWPEIRQEGNTHVSLAESTVMVINRAGTIKTHGPSKTLLEQDTATPAASAAPSPSQPK